mgnify:FL=1
MMDSFPLFPVRDNAIGDEALREFGWGELAARLAARLAAARDLRGSLDQGRACAGGSFSRFASGAGEDVNMATSGVNLTGLTDGKDAGRKVGASDVGMQPADREMQ